MKDKLPMAPAARLAIFQDMIDAGMLCHCPTVEIETEDWMGDVCKKKVIDHQDNCEAKTKALEILG